MEYRGRGRDTLPGRIPFPPLFLALCLSVCFVVVESAPVVTSARHSMRPASELGMTVEFDYADIFFNETVFVADATSLYGCAASTCSSCNVSAVTYSPTCPTNHTCLNMTQSYVYDRATTTSGSNTFYTIYFPPCSNLIVLAFPSSGSATLYMSQNDIKYPTNSAYHWSSSLDNSQPEQMGFCCGAGNPTFQADTALYINVYANTNLTFELFVYDMSEFLPAKYFYYLVDLTVRCADGQCGTYTGNVTCLYTAPTLPSNDTGFNYLAQRGKDPLPGVYFVGNDAQVSLWRQVNSTSPQGLPQSYEPYLGGCNVTFNNLVNAYGERVTTVAPLELYEPACDQTKFQSAVDGLNSLTALYDTASSDDDFNQLLFYSNAFVASDGWVGCQWWIDRTFVREQQTFNVTESTIRCTSTDPSFNASNDACCNYLLQWSETCEAQEIRYAVTTYEAIETNVEAMCDSEPGCIYLSLADYASAMEFDDDPSHNCAASLIQAGDYRNQNHGRDCEARMVGSYCDSIIDCAKGQTCSVFHRCTIPCQFDSDCPTNSTCGWGGGCSFPIDCVVDDMSDQEKNYIRAQWGLSDAQSQGTEFFDIFTANVTAPTCEGGPEIDMYSLTGQCVGSPSCNWSPCQIKPLNASNREMYCEDNCKNKSYAIEPAQPDYFCGLCSPESPESCFEVSQYPGCHMSGDNNIIDNNYGCSWFEQLFPGYVGANYMNQECTFSSSLVTNAPTCLATSQFNANGNWFLGDCQYLRYEAPLLFFPLPCHLLGFLTIVIQVESFGQYRLVCDGYCHLHGAEWEGICNPTDCEILFDGQCEWNTVVESCVLKAYQSFQSCLFSTYGGSLYWNHEFSWRLPAFDNATSCAAGSCFPHGAGIDQATCEATPWCSVSCSYGECQNKTDCEAAGACDDTELTNPYGSYNAGTLDYIEGVCVYPFQLTTDSFGVSVSCPVWTKQGRIGCLDYTVPNEASCNATLPQYGTPRWMSSVTTKAGCVAYGMGCLEETYTYAQSTMGNPGTGFLSPKNESECLAAGGTLTPYYNWTQGIWYEGGRWQGFEWKQRNWTTSYNKTLVNDFSIDTYNTLTTAAQVSELASQFKSDQFCRYNRLIDTFGGVICSCLNSSGSTCAGQSVGVTVGVSRACSHTAFELALPGMGTVSWNLLLEFNPTCVDVNVFTVAVSQFQKDGDTTFVSNIFVKAIESEPTGYSIVENSHGVIVGQLIGDGLLIDFTNGQESAQIVSTTDANFTVCMYVRSDIVLDTAFDQYDLAYSNAVYSKWTPMNAKVTVDSAGLLCGVLPAPYPTTLTTIFPVWRKSGDWAGETFIESLGTSTVALFYLAVALYALLLVPNTLAIANQLWLFKYELADAGDRSFGTVVWTMLSMGRIIHCCIEAILILRVIYFAMLPTGVLNDVNVVVYVILGEVPVYLFLSIYTLLILFWVELVHWALKRGGGSVLLKRMKIMFLIVNAFMYAFLIVLVIIFIALEASSSSTDTSCKSAYFLSQSDPNKEMKDAREGLAIFYQSVIIAIALFLAIAFVVYGTWVLVTLYRVKSMSKRLAKMKRNKMAKFSLVLAVCTLSLLCMCGFLLYGTIDQSMSAVGAIIFVIVVEILPLLLLIFTVYSKRKSVFRLWYSYAKSRGTSAFGLSAESRSHTSTNSSNELDARSSSINHQDSSASSL